MPAQTPEPIPIPLREQWRYFRVTYLPVGVFLVLLLLTAWLWRQHVMPPVIVGAVSPVRTTVISGIDGTLVDVKVQLLDPVTNGQILAVVSPVDSEQLRAELAAIEADTKLAGARLDLDKIRNLNSYSQLRLDLRTEQLALELAEIRLQQAQAELDRAQKLLDAGFISRGVGANRNDFGYDVALRDRDALAAEIHARRTNIAELEAALQKLEAAGATNAAPEDTNIEQAILALQNRLRQLMKPVVLRAPIDGFVSAQYAYPGQRVTANTPLLVISADKSTEIIAWLRQPTPETMPAPGDTVLVQRPVPGQPKFYATVLKVGRQLEQIHPEASPFLATPQRIEFGLPMLVKAPPNMPLIPGEPVQLKLLKKSGAQPSPQ